MQSSMKTTRGRRKGARVQGNGRGGGRVARGPAPAIRKKRRGAAKKSSLSRNSSTVVGAGYDVKVQNPGASIVSSIDDALTIHGRIPFATWTGHVVAGSASKTFFTPLNTSLAPSFSNIVWINPVNLFPTTSREYAICSGYAEFHFSKLKFIVQSTTATSVEASGVIAYSADGALTGSAFDSSNEILSFPNSTAMPAWGSRTLDVSPSINSNNWFYMDIGSTAGVSNDADYRMSLQGCLGGYTNGFDVGLGDGYVFATIYVEYTIRLKGPRVGGDLVLAGSVKDAMAKRSSFRLTQKAEKAAVLHDYEQFCLDRRLRLESKDPSDLTTSEPVIVEQPGTPLRTSVTPLRVGGRSVSRDRKAEK